MSLDGKQRAEDDCKIVKLGERSVFASSGYTSAYGKLGIVEFSNDFAREAYRKSPDDPREMVDFWIYNMGRALTVVASPASLASADKGLIVMAVFGTGSRSTIEVWRGEIRYESGKLNAFSQEVNPLHYRLFTDRFEEYVSEFREGKTERAIEPHKKARREAVSSGSFADYDAYELGELVEAVETWSNDESVGGPIDVVVLRAGHAAKWVRHKANCRQSSPGAFTHLQQEIERTSTR